MFQRFLHPWILWSFASIGASIGLGFGLVGSRSDDMSEFSNVYLPGRTTSGHHQIEQKCNACHAEDGSVREESCLDCHQEDLKRSQDTHPKSKFRDPTKLVLLEKIDASNCLTCHREHDAERTLEMGVTVPIDYCWHCHEDVADDRPSHADFEFDTCTNAGCHNYHDNTALYENFLKNHLGEENHFTNAFVLLRSSTVSDSAKSLNANGADAPPSLQGDDEILKDWATTLHAQSGVNCSSCHQTQADTTEEKWSARVSLDVCQTCHESQSTTFLAGKHGMRISAGLSPMSPAMARLPMHADAAHRTLDCNSCHQGHRFDTQFAAVDACLQCHSDDHSLAYKESSHFSLWKEEIIGVGELGTGVSCATCHMPRTESSDGKTTVVHNQNWNLEPNEKMVRSVCANCHGVSFSLDALASAELIENCFSTAPETHVQSLEMVREWFERKQSKRK